MSTVGIGWDGADIVNSLIYLARGKHEEAGWSAVFAIPGIIKVGKKGGKAVGGLLDGLEGAKKGGKWIKEVKVVYKVSVDQREEFSQWMKKTLGNLADNLKWEEEMIVQIQTPDGLTIPVKMSIKETGEEAGEKVAKVAINGGSGATRNLSKSDLGELIGKGGNKEVYSFGDGKVIAIMQDGKPLTAIDDEINMLRQLDELGLPTLNAENVIIDGKPGILMDRCAQESKSIVSLDKKKGKVMLKPNADTSLLNQNSIDDLIKIKQIMNNNKIKIDDLQFLIKEDGHIVIADPLKVSVGQLPSKNNNRMMDLLIEKAKKNR